ncbi:MAG: DUF1810 domain-containing protein [Clostridia bacterium]|nr:DUF1810 domain-containing protein [Clostridia bacterium]
MNQAPDLSRYTEAHRDSYRNALAEIKNGRKTSHWMWYIFPQIHGLGMSSTSRYYAIRDQAEAIAFLRDPYLGGNLTEITGALLALDGNDAGAIFGWPDDMKLRSCMTLFAAVSEEGSVFHQVLDRYFGGKPDEKTLSILGQR